MNNKDLEALPYEFKSDASYNNAGFIKTVEFKKGDNAAMKSNSTEPCILWVIAGHAAKGYLAMESVKIPAILFERGQVFDTEQKAKKHVNSLGWKIKV